MTTVYFDESHHYEMKINKLALCSYQTIPIPPFLMGTILTLDDNKDIYLITTTIKNSNYVDMGIRIHTKNKLRNFSGYYIGEVSRDDTDWHVFIQEKELIHRLYVENRKG